MIIYHFTQEQLRKVLEETIGMYNEYRFKYGYISEESKSKAVDELIEGLDAERELAQQHECKPNQVLMEEGLATLAAELSTPYCSYCHSYHYGYQQHAGA